MFQKMLAGALIAGCAAGLLAALLHFAFVQDLILTGELYESGEAVHAPFGPGGHDHADDAAGEAAGHDHGSHDHGDESSALARNGWTVLFTVLVYVAYAMMLVAGFGMAESLGHRIGAAEGLLWGIAGFASFQLAPAMGLAPELPGTLAADLAERQVWWWGTVAATAVALALLGYVRKPWAVGLGVALLAAPHLIGAPAPGDYSGVAPPEVAAAFAARVLGVGLAVWAVLGWTAGYFWSRGDVR